MPAPKDRAKKVIWINNLSQSHKGQVAWNKGKIGVMPIPWNKGKHPGNFGNGFKKNNIPWNKGGKFSQISGKKHTE